PPRTGRGAGRGAGPPARGVARSADPPPPGGPDFLGGRRTPQPLRRRRQEAVAAGPGGFAPRARRRGAMNPANDRPPGPVGGPAGDDPRVTAPLEESLAALKPGQKPARQAFLARHAEIAGALDEALDGMEALHEAVPPAPSSPGGPGPTEPW